VQGNLGPPDAHGYVQFDGATSIECETPGIAPIWAELYPAATPLETHISCPCQLGAPLFAGADARIAPGARPNPVIAAPELGMIYSLPRDGGKARSRIVIGGGSYASHSWSVENRGNQLLLGGLNGPAIIAADAQFGWMGYLDPAWKVSFEPLLGLAMGHWYQSPASFTSVSPVPSSYTLFTAAHRFHIGYNPVTDEYFNGALRKAVIDPGCTSY
jgi:hypothetical protein